MRNNRRNKRTSKLWQAASSLSFVRLSSMIIHKISMVQKQNRLNKQDYFFVFVFFFFFAFYTNNSISSEMNITCCHSLTHSLQSVVYAAAITVGSIFRRLVCQFVWPAG